MEIFTDRQLLEKSQLDRLRAGDEAALREIFNQNFKMLTIEAFRLTSEQAVAKDLAQEVFYELWKRRESLQIQTSLEAYLRRAVRNRALNFLKTQKKYLFDEDLAAENLETRHSENFHQNFDEKEDLVAALHDAIAELPEKCRQVFMLSRFEDLSHREIAERLEISTKTIENQITKALRMLREKMVGQAVLSVIGILVSLLFSK